MATDSDDQYSRRMPVELSGADETVESTHERSGQDTPTAAPWYVHEDDLIGGWAVMNVNKPPSQCDHRKGEGEVAGFVRRADARLIVHLRNAFAEDAR